MKIYKTHFAKSKFDLKSLVRTYRKQGYDAIQFPNGETMIL